MQGQSAKFARAAWQVALTASSCSRPGRQRKHRRAIRPRPSSFWCPIPRGGLPDTVARIVGRRLQERLAQSVVIENRPRRERQGGGRGAAERSGRAATRWSSPMVPSCRSIRCSTRTPGSARGCRPDSTQPLSFCRSRGDNPYVGVPVFPSRSFRHSGVYVRTDRGIRAPGDLRAARSASPSTSSPPTSGFAPSWRTISVSSLRLSTGCAAASSSRDGRRRCRSPCLRVVTLTEAPAGRSLSELLLAGEIDGLIGPRTPSAMTAADAPIGWLFPDPRAAAIE